MTGSSSAAFGEAARAVVGGDVATLRELVARDPSLVHARSGDACRATLLHFVAANGVPDELQRTPPNAVEVCRLLLESGAQPDATCDAYGGGPNATSLCLLVSSWHPFERGLQPDLVRELVTGGARVDGLRDDGAPLATALVFGYTRAAEVLVELGARVDNLFFAAGLGRLDEVRAWFDAKGRLREGALGRYAPVLREPLPNEPTQIVQEALHFAVTHGRADVLELLLARGARADAATRGHHAEQPLCQALFVGEYGTIPILVAHGADPGRRDGKLGRSARELASAVDAPAQVRELLCRTGGGSPPPADHAP